MKFKVFSIENMYVFGKNRLIAHLSATKMLESLAGCRKMFLLQFSVR